MKVTLKKVMSLAPCYTKAQVKAALAHGKLVDVLESVPYRDARWLIVRLMSRDNLENWAYACADRAAGYYASSASSAAAAYYAAAAAADAARRNEECTAISHAVQMIWEQEEA